jgi:oxygen-independent coproporphyrinogen-3 oxidase
MALAVYVHIPYCLQRCRYCDFTTFEFTEILPPQQYANQVLSEIRNRHSFWPTREIETLYFGGGTPSLIEPHLIVAIRQELANVGFRFLPDCETTIEINPATLDEAKLNLYLEAGFNRFSVGAQSFNDDLLKMCGRKHGANDTRETLRLLQKYHLNYSFDLLFALPRQTLDQLKLDLDEVAIFQPPHLSAYCLTVPEGHPMNANRPLEDEQVTMFEMIEQELKTIGLLSYEISNFARPGFESRHNMAYWRDVSYWGIGLSSHSYARDTGGFGQRFWNPKSLNDYALQAPSVGASFDQVLPVGQWETLAEHESLTDFCHMFLRTHRGLPESALRAKFSPLATQLVLPRLQQLLTRGWLESCAEGWRLTTEGRLLSNKVFETLTFLHADLMPQAALTRRFISHENPKEMALTRVDT